MNRNKLIIIAGILLLLIIGIIVILKVTKVIKLPPKDDNIGDCCGANLKEAALFAVTGICTGGSGQPGDPYNMYCAPGGFCAGSCCSNDPGEYWSCLQDQTVCPPNQYSNYHGDCCGVGQGLDINAHCCQLGTKGCCVPTIDTIDSQGSCCPIKNITDINGVCCQNDVDTLDINGKCCGPFQGTNFQGACCDFTGSDDCCTPEAWKIFGADCIFYPECGAYTSANVCCTNPGTNNCCPLAMGMDVYGNCCNSGVGCCSYDQISQHACPPLVIADLSTLDNKSVNIVLQTDRYTGFSSTTITFPNFTELYLSSSPVTYTGKYNATNGTLTFSTIVDGKTYALAISGGINFKDDPYRIANWLQDPSLFNSYQLLGFTIQNNAVVPVSISAIDGTIYYGNGNILQDITAQSLYFEFPPLNRPHDTIQSVNLTPSVV